jgi:small-conductance mechanosensitive channel
MAFGDFLRKKIHIVDGISIHLDKVIFAALILLGTWLLIKLLRRVITRPNFIADKISMKRQITIFLVTKYFVWFFSIILALSAVGINLTTLLLGSTALLVGLGLGLQHIFTDLVSGFFLLFEGSLKIGDVIEVDGVIGKVMEINLRSCELKTRDDVIIIIPNSKFLAEKVVNWSHGSEQVRFTVDVSVAYGSNIDTVYECLEAAMNEHKQISQSPKPFVRFVAFGDSSLQFNMMFWSKNTFRIENVKSELRRDVYTRLSEHGLNIPFPQRDVHIKGLEQMISAKEKGLEN